MRNIGIIETTESVETFLDRYPECKEKGVVYDAEQDTFEDFFQKEDEFLIIPPQTNLEEIKKSSLKDISEDQCVIFIIENVQQYNKEDWPFYQEIVSQLSFIKETRNSCFSGYCDSQYRNIQENSFSEILSERVSENMSEGEEMLEIPKRQLIKLLDSLEYETYHLKKLLDDK